jgi:hypothetical protein
MADTSPPEPVRMIRADALQRASRAWAARVAGGTWAQAAELSGFSDVTACHHAVRSAYGQLPKPDREELRDMWRDRLELSWRQAVKDMTEQRAGATTASVRIAGLAVMLDGLAEPTRLDVTVSDMFTRLTAELAANDL